MLTWTLSLIPPRALHYGAPNAIPAWTLTPGRWVDGQRLGDGWTLSDGGELRHTEDLGETLRRMGVPMPSGELLAEVSRG